MIVIAGKNDIAVHGLLLAIDYFDTEKIIVIANSNDEGIDSWQRSLLKVAREKNITVKTLEEVYESEISCFISLEFDQIVKPEKLRTDKIYNIHFSELPKYKGMYTSVWPILYADKHSGVTLHKIDQGIDTGDVIAQKIFKLSESDRSQDCYSKYIDSAKSLLSEWFVKIIEKDIQSTKQTAVNSTYFSKKTIDYSKINIDLKKTAWQIKRQLYAFSFRPYQLVRFDNKQITDIVIRDERSLLKPGTVIAKSESCFTIATIDYNIELYVDNLSHILEQIPTMSLASFSKNIVRTLGVNDRDAKGWSAIIVAAYYGRKDLIDFLLQNGANINDIDYCGTTVLMYAKDFAIKNHDSSFMSFLIEKGADPSLEDWSGRTLFDYITNEQAKFLGVKR